MSKVILGLIDACPYTQSLPFMVKPLMGTPMLVPQINMSVELAGLPEGLDSIAEELGLEKRRLRAVYQTGKEAWLEFKEVLRRDHGEIPAINLVYGGTAGSSQMLTLEAFLHQAKNFAARKDRKA